MNALLPQAYTKMMSTATSASHALIALVAHAMAAAAQAQVIALIVFQDDTLTQHPPHEHVRTVMSDTTKVAQMKRHARLATQASTRHKSNRHSALCVRGANTLLRQHR
jgi:hypothetical protein